MPPCSRLGVGRPDRRWRVLAAAFRFGVTIETATSRESVRRASGRPRCQVTVEEATVRFGLGALSTLEKVDAALFAAKEMAVEGR